MNSHFDVAVIGGGIVGLAHALAASRRGLSVGLFERSSAAQGASVRNFGMIWPIGQPGGPLYELALQSRLRWLDLDRQGVVSAETCGSIHVARQPDELAVLEEFCALGSHDARMVNPNQIADLSPLVRTDGLLGGMHSPTELRVDPRTASANIAAWLTETGRADCHFETLISGVSDGRIEASDGRCWRADRILVCSGSDLETLFPESLQKSGLKLCKLQMLKTSQRPPTKPSPHIASGLTLRHYTSFNACPSLAGLRQRIAQQSPELDQYGIHVMASTFPSGDVILGDSHEYGDDISPFDKPQIDDRIIRELRELIHLDDWTVRQRWHGIYAKHTSLPIYHDTPAGAVDVFVGTGGAGMTMAHGLAEQTWQQWAGDPS
ncbi:bifunctional tRNA (mnm(5)s(2)U34)-methyltransferase/FAD-dependent cmnm(5)s(2)U34 oxidoreductase [Rubripirellula lacrimiformis]|uniref:Bifunctional tRNA (Mnm(5)s(2)U34)-methyltransferase/FAD-dependent cmnm(5)s(2)U34 oxidoreductase n=1 Tax=Rubripirellula lacrimiformis TaxID=1930273 RepID=A0A517NL53_9BACT|nr:TIGR03364 family FAD-dependent oxidoreductase [Rubripirellula lacrimiformis]QDT07860.1 bifunctional tRNA (mnm(5)s(2)U34)-methyltransferase/FAD-dependent cmnm(5)s(2)U34 oxidoreductase [Rubripirellula lacrimiformis]